MSKLQRTLSLLAFVLVAALLSGQLVSAQSAPMRSPSSPVAQDQEKHQDDQNTTQQQDVQNETQKIFTGTIVKSGAKLVLTDSITNTNYQLDDQQKAKGFVNKNVRVTGVLDVSTGTIRV